MNQALHINDVWTIVMLICIAKCYSLDINSDLRFWELEGKNTINKCCIKFDTHRSFDLPYVPIIGIFLQSSPWLEILFPFRATYFQYLSVSFVSLLVFATNLAINFAKLANNCGRILWRRGKGRLDFRLGRTQRLGSRTRFTKFFFWDCIPKAVGLSHFGV